MNDQYKIAEISETCISEINALQEKINQNSGQDVVLIAYQSQKADK